MESMFLSSPFVPILDTALPKVFILSNHAVRIRLGHLKQLQDTRPYDDAHSIEDQFEI